MTFPKTLASELAEIGFGKTGPLTFAMPSAPESIKWQLSFRALGFAKNQIDGVLQYRHPICTAFGWRCLITYGGPKWSQLFARRPAPELSGGFSIGLIAKWGSDHTFDNAGMKPDEAAAKVSRDVELKVLPFIESIATDHKLLNFLKLDDEPAPWFRSQCLCRLAEIAKLEVILSLNDSEIERLADFHSALLQDQLDGVPLRHFVADIVKAARRQS